MEVKGIRGYREGERLPQFKNFKFYVASQTSGDGATTRLMCLLLSGAFVLFIVFHSRTQFLFNTVQKNLQHTAHSHTHKTMASEFSFSLTFLRIIDCLVPFHTRCSLMYATYGLPPFFFSPFLFKNNKKKANWVNIEASIKYQRQY